MSLIELTIPLTMNPLIIASGFVVILTAAIVFLLYQDQILQWLEDKLSFVWSSEITLRITNDLKPDDFLRIGFGVLCLSLMQWILTYAWVDSLLISLNTPLPFWVVVFSASLAVLSKVTPFLSIGNLGAFEMGMGMGFVAFGMPFDLALSNSLLVTLLTLGMSAVSFCFVRLCCK